MNTRIAGIFVLIFAMSASCNRTFVPEQPSEHDGTHKTFTLSFNDGTAAPSAGDSILYYTSNAGTIKSAKITRHNGVFTAELETEPNDGFVVAVLGNAAIGEHSRQSVTFLDMIPGTQGGAAGECAISVASASMPDNELKFVPVTGTLSFSVSRSTTRTVLLSAPGNPCIHSFPETEFRIAEASANATIGAAIHDTIAIPTPSTGDYHVVLLPSSFPEGIAFNCLDTDGCLVSKTVLQGPITVMNGRDGHVGIIDAVSSDPTQPGIHYERNDSIKISGYPTSCAYLVPFSVDITFEGKHYDSEIISSDGTVTCQDGMLIPTAIGRHTLTVYIHYNDNVRYFKQFDVEVHSDSYLDMVIRAKEGLSPTYGNSEVILSHDGQLPLTFTFSVRVNIEPLIGQTMQEWLFPEQQLSLQPAGKAVLSDYSKLSTIVRKHLTASFSVDIFLNCEDEYRKVNFNAENIRLNLMHSLDRTIPFSYNGERLW